MQWCLEAADEMDQEIIRDGRLASVVATITDDLVVEEIIIVSTLSSSLHSYFTNSTSSSFSSNCRRAWRMTPKKRYLSRVVGGTQIGVIDVFPGHNPN